MPVTPLNIGARRGLSYGLRLPPELQQGLKPPETQPEPWNEQPAFNGRGFALSEALQSTPQVQGNSLVEALGAAVTGGMAGRSARNTREMEMALAGEERERAAAERKSEESLRQAQIARLLSQADEEEQPDVRVTQSGTFWSPEIDPQTGSPRILGRDPNWQPPATLQLPQPGMPVQGAAGYRWGEGGTQEAVPGGPADYRQTAEGRSRAQQLESSERQLQNALDVLTNDTNTFQNAATGFWGGLTRGQPGTPAYDLDQALEPVRAILSFESLAEMRRNSATGGALGSIAVRELELLGNTVRSLEVGQSPQQLARNLGAVRAQLRRALTAVQAARAEMAQAAPEASAPSGDGATTERVLRWNPSTGQLE